MIANQIKNQITTEELFSQKTYWLNQLSGELPETNFLTDNVRSATYRGKNKSITFELSSGLSEVITKFTKNSYLSIYLILLSTLSILLQKSNRNNSIIVGSPIYQPEGSNDCLNNKVIPLRFDINNQFTFKDFLLQVQDTTIDGYVHQNYPFDELIQLLKLPNNQNRCPIFDIAIFLENIHRQQDIADIRNDLTFSFIVHENLIKGKIYYNDYLFQEESIKIIARSYISILECVINNFHVRISDIAILKKEDKEQLLEKFNDNAKQYPINQTIHKLFENQVEQTPQKIGVVFENTQLTYQELNEKANQLARFLRDLGVQKGEFVGIVKERDINFLIGILAIYKAGGVYVPIDSTYPSDRIKYMLANSEVRILLIDSSCLNILTGLLEHCLHLKCLICLDVNPNDREFFTLADVNIYEQLDFDKFSKENLELSNEGINRAYMIYTSGSTGLPKGAIIRHGSAINHICAQFDALELTEDVTFVQSALASSDISVWQFLSPILIGGKTVIVDTETVCNPEKLFKVIKNEKITIVELVPVLLTGLLDYISCLSTHERLLPDLKWMMVTGESVSVDLVNRWLHIYPSIRLVNAYGPTEATDDITQFIIEKPLPQNQRTVPIGKPLANLNLYILDSQMQLLPIGVPGEICVSGFAVGEGYWKNEESTKLNFVPNPFPNTAKLLPGSNKDLIYKTGDLGRWLPDGNIEFLGRIDHQVKIRGFRIELGEIEARLCQHPAVGGTVVVVREDIPGDKQLIAYVIPSAEWQGQHGDSNSELKTLDSAISSELISQLRNFLKQRLPDYMLPSALVLLEALPLAPSGKVDRRALPAPDTLRSDLEKGFIPPRTPAEETVTAIWSDVLKQKQVGIHDNFFDLGGHSLLATQVISRLRAAFEVEFPLRSLFEEPTIARLVERIEKIQSVQQLQSLPMNTVDDREEIEL
ncbi:amino acid adenylation domain-containing protein (plasmid) [Nostoc sp. UHCC 0926]|uniref:non-ribosomal peptide synthetase n=1 Tax=Nostoc sp. UHCC 0926 TaxID=3025190 RepID=UPI002362F8B5|nr:amino acid adenylation domain-containing protein [Nostoc sp. UHCC 0926]WDD36955.1 amino acid adenylation domain-containing protein [Nostoc sp. UHCC 0926]